MNKDNVDASRTVSASNRVPLINKDRTEWKLSEWSAYFDRHDIPHIMTSEEIAAAVLWLTEKGYPTPTDCPKRPETTPRDGGCPAFKPMCLLTPICQMARGMCDMINDMSKCPTCGKMFNQNTLRDNLSRREFRISGMCQSCQDSVFGRSND